MKKQIKKTVLTLLALVSAFGFVACNDEEEMSKGMNNVTLKTITGRQKALIDNYAEDVASFHGGVSTEYMDRYSEIPFDSQTLYQYVIDKISLYPFQYMSITDSSYMPTVESIDSMLAISTNAVWDLSVFDSLELYSDVTIAVIYNKIDELETILSTAYTDCVDYDDFIRIYDSLESDMLADVRSVEDYMCVKMCSSVQLNSFLTWGEYYNRSIATKNLFGWLCHKVEKLWHSVSPIVKEDVKGAGVGALFGLCYSLKTGAISSLELTAINVGLGAVSGATSASATAAVNR